MLVDFTLEELRSLEIFMLTSEKLIAEDFLPNAKGHILLSKLFAAEDKEKASK
jgi:hypothetical protein